MFPRTTLAVGAMAAAGWALWPAAAGPPDTAPGAAAGDAALAPAAEALLELAATDDRTPAAVAPAARVVRAGTDPGLSAMILEAYRFARTPAAADALEAALLDRTGEPARGHDAWFRWAWARDYTPHPDYLAFKRRLYARIDPRFAAYFADGRDRTATIRLDEIRWGGVRRDGIPPLDRPATLTAAGAVRLGELNDDDRVFGVVVNGEPRAYPQRILARHELVRDRVGGREIVGVYCTLCGAMIVYDPTVAGTTHRLGTSGFLYRSNKLMYDAATESLWSTLAGAPVVGPLVGRGIELKTLPVVTATWGAWRRRHPSTRVLSFETGHDRDYGAGAAYREYFADDALMFPVPDPAPDERAAVERGDRADPRALKNKAEVLAVRPPPGAAGELGDGGGARPLAIAAAFLDDRRVYHDAVGGVRFVVVTDASGNRVYRTGGATFRAAETNRAAGPDELEDAAGARWRVTEEALVESPGDRRLPRLPAHRAFWFGWRAAFPNTRLVFE